MQPNFNMEQAARMLNEYKGGHETLPVAWDVVDDFMAEYQGRNVQFSPRNVQKERLLTASEYARLRSDWNDYTHRGYQFIERPNGGIVVDMHHALVYTDRHGEPEFVLDVQQDDLFDNNDVIQIMMICEEAGIPHESQQELLESYFGAAGARFRNAGERRSTEGEDREGTGYDARGVGQRDPGKVPSEEIKKALRTPAPATTRVYLLSLPDTDLTTEGQKDAMRRYKAYVDELRGLEEQRATQEELAQTQMPPICRMPHIRSMLAAFFIQYRRKRLTIPAKNGTL